MHPDDSMRPLLLSLLSLLSLPLLAADLQVRDIRIEIGRGEVSDFDGEIRYRSGPNSMFASETLTDDEWDGDSPFFLSALYTRGNLDPVGFVWAVGIEYQGSSTEVVGETFDTDLVGAKGRAGVGWTPAPLWRVEATAEGHLGYVRSEDADVTSSGEIDRSDATGVYSAIGLQIGAGYVFKGKWDVGVSLRAMRYSAQLDADFGVTGGSYEADISWVYLSAAVTGGYRF